MFPSTILPFVCRKRRTLGTTIVRGITSAIVRGISDSFGDALSSTTTIVDMDIARQQHADYCHVLQRTLGLAVNYLPSLHDLPDSCFVEDATVVVDRRAVLLRTGHETRRKEVDSIGVALQENHDVEIVSDMRQENFAATCDGGDVLCVGEWIFCGISQRTTMEGAAVLESAFGDTRTIVPLKTPSEFLHLKSAATALTDTAVLMHEGVDDVFVHAFSSRGIKVYQIDDSLACNVLSINKTIVAQEKMSLESLRTLEMAAQKNGMELVHVDTSELAKKDAALTCCSILIE